MRHLILAAAVATGLSLTAGTAVAAPHVNLDISTPSGIVDVSGGCGPRGYRASDGRCYPRRRPPPPRQYRGCPPGTHPTPYGCRRNF